MRYVPVDFDARPGDKYDLPKRKGLHLSAVDYDPVHGARPIALPSPLLNDPAWNPMATGIPERGVSAVNHHDPVDAVTRAAPVASDGVSSPLRERERRGLHAPLKETLQEQLHSLETGEYRLGDEVRHPAGRVVNAPAQSMDQDSIERLARSKQPLRREWQDVPVPEGEEPLLMDSVLDRPRSLRDKWNKTSEIKRRRDAMQQKHPGEAGPMSPDFGRSRGRGLDTSAIDGRSPRTFRPQPKERNWLAQEFAGGMWQYPASTIPQFLAFAGDLISRGPGGKEAGDAIHNLGVQVSRWAKDGAELNPPTVDKDFFGVVHDLATEGKIGQFAQWSIGGIARFLPQIGQSMLLGAAITLGVKKLIPASMLAGGTATATGMGAVANHFGRAFMQKAVERQAKRHLIARGLTLTGASAVQRQAAFSLAARQFQTTVAAKASSFIIPTVMYTGSNYMEAYEQWGVKDPHSALATGMMAGFISTLVPGGSGKYALIQNKLGPQKAAQYQAALKAMDQNVLGRIVREVFKVAPRAALEEFWQESFALANALWHDPELDGLTEVMMSYMQNVRRPAASGMAVAMHSGVPGGVRQGVFMGPGGGGNDGGAGARAAGLDAARSAVSARSRMIRSLDVATGKPVLTPDEAKAVEAIKARSPDNWKDALTLAEGDELDALEIIRAIPGADDLDVLHDRADALEQRLDSRWQQMEADRAERIRTEQERTERTKPVDILTGEPLEQASEQPEAIQGQAGDKLDMTMRPQQEGQTSEQDVQEGQRGAQGDPAQGDGAPVQAQVPVPGVPGAAADQQHSGVQGDGRGLSVPDSQVPVEAAAIRRPAKAPADMDARELRRELAALGVDRFELKGKRKLKPVSVRLSRAERKRVADGAKIGVNVKVRGKEVSREKSVDLLRDLLKAELARSERIVKRSGSKAARKGAVSYRRDDAISPVINAINSLGMIQMPKVSDPGGAVSDMRRIAQSGDYDGIVDDHLKVRVPANMGVFSKNGKYRPDTILDELKSQGILPMATSLDDLWEAILQEVENYNDPQSAKLTGIPSWDALSKSEADHWDALGDDYDAAVAAMEAGIKNGSLFAPGSDVLVEGLGEDGDSFRVDRAYVGDDMSIRYALVSNQTGDVYDVASADIDGRTLYVANREHEAAEMIRTLGEHDADEKDYLDHLIEIGIDFDEASYYDGAEWGIEYEQQGRDAKQPEIEEAPRLLPDKGIPRRTGDEGGRDAPERGTGPDAADDARGSDADARTGDGTGREETGEAESGSRPRTAGVRTGELPARKPPAIANQRGDNLLGGQEQDALFGPVDRAVFYRDLNGNKVQASDVKGWRSWIKQTVKPMRRNADVLKMFNALLEGDGGEQAAINFARKEAGLPPLSEQAADQNATIIRDENAVKSAESPDAGMEKAGSVVPVRKTADRPSLKARFHFATKNSSALAKEKESIRENGYAADEVSGFVDRHFNRDAYAGIFSEPGRYVLAPMPSTTGDNSIPLVLAHKLAREFSDGDVQIEVMEGNWAEPLHVKKSSQLSGLEKLTATREFSINTVPQSGAAVVVIEDLVTTAANLDALEDALSQNGVMMNAVASLGQGNNRISADGDFHYLAEWLTKPDEKGNIAVDASRSEVYDAVSSVFKGTLRRKINYVIRGTHSENDKQTAWAFIRRSARGDAPSVDRVQLRQSPRTEMVPRSPSPTSRILLPQNEIQTGSTPQNKSSVEGAEPGQLQDFGEKLGGALPLGSKLNIATVKDAILVDAARDEDGVRFEYWQKGDKAAYRALDLDSGNPVGGIFKGPAKSVRAKYDRDVEKAKATSEKWLPTGIDQIARRAEREGGQFLITENMNAQGSADLPDLPHGTSIEASSDTEAQDLISDAPAESSPQAKREKVEVKRPALNLSEADQKRLKDIQDKLRANLKGRLGMNPMLDPENVSLAAQMASLYAQGGIKTFEQFAHNVSVDMADMWDALKNFLHGAWQTAGAVDDSLDDVSRTDARNVISVIDNTRQEAENSLVDKEVPDGQNERSDRLAAQDSDAGSDPVGSPGTAESRGGRVAGPDVQDSQLGAGEGGSDPGLSDGSMGVAGQQPSGSRRGGVQGNREFPVVPKSSVGNRDALAKPDAGATGTGFPAGSLNYSLASKAPVMLTKGQRRQINEQVKSLLSRGGPFSDSELDVLRQYTGEGGLSSGTEEALTQHYTSYDVIRSMYDAILTAGFEESYKADELEAKYQADLREAGLETDDEVLAARGGAVQAAGIDRGAFNAALQAEARLTPWAADRAQAVDSVDALPARVRSAIEGGDAVTMKDGAGQVRAVTMGDRSWFILDRYNDAAELTRDIREEAFHRIENEFADKAKMQRLGLNVYRGQWKAVAKEIQNNYGFEPGSVDFFRELAAKAYRDGQTNRSVWGRFVDAVVAAFRRVGRSLGMNLAATDAELRDYVNGVQKAREYGFRTRKIQPGSEKSSLAALADISDPSGLSAFIGKPLREAIPSMPDNAIPDESRTAPRGDNAQLKTLATRIYSKFPRTVKTPDGRTVQTAVKQGPGSPTFFNTVMHLSTFNDRSTPDRSKIQWMPSVPETLQNATIKLHDSEENSDIYVRRYGDVLHAVVVRSDNTVSDHSAQAALVTQFPDRIDTDRKKESRRYAMRITGIYGSGNDGTVTTRSAVRRGASQTQSSYENNPISTDLDQPLFARSDRDAPYSAEESRAGEDAQPSKAATKFEQMYRTAEDFAVSALGTVLNRSRQSKNAKPDVSMMDVAFSTIAHYSSKVPGLRMVFQSGVRLMDNKHRFESMIFNQGPNGEGASDLNYLTEFSRKGLKENPEWKRVNDYLIQRDIDAVGYSVVGDELNGYRIRPPDNPETSAQKPFLEEVWKNEEAAWEIAHELEAEDMVKAGFSREAASAVLAFRRMNDRIYHQQLGEVHSARDELSKLGLELKQVKNAKGEMVDIFTALKEMGNLRGWHVPRMRKSGKYLLYAHKEGEAPVMKVFATNLARNTEARSLERDGWKVDLQDSNRPSEEVFLDANITAMNDLMQNALERVQKVKDSDMSLDRFGLKGQWLDYYPRGESKPEKHFVLEGPLTKQQHVVLKSLGGRYFSIGGGPKKWRFIAATKGIEKRILHALTHGEMMQMQANAFGEAIVRNIADMIHQRGSRSMKIGRRQAKGMDVYRGYETDMVRAITLAGKATAGGTAKRLMAKEMMRAITGQHKTWAQWLNEHHDELANLDTQEDVDRRRSELYTEYVDMIESDRIDSAKQPNAYKDALAYMRDMLRNEEPSERVIGMIKGLAALKYMSSISSGLVNLSSMYITVPAVMKAYGEIPIGKTIPLVNAAMRDYTKFYLHEKFGKGEGLSGEAADLFREITLRGWDQALMNYEALNALQGHVSRAHSKVVELGMLSYAIVERLNRMSTIAAAYRGIKDLHKGEWTTEDHEAALLKAKDMSDKANAVFGKTNLPSWARGSSLGVQAARSAYMFKSFTHNYLILAKEMGLDKQDYKSFFYLLLSQGVIGGAGASVLTPALSFLVKALATMVPGLDPPDDPEEDFYQWLGDTFGGYAARTARFGLLGAAGVSIKGSLQMDFAPPRTIVDFLGAPASVLQDVYYGSQNIGRGNILKGLEQMAPRFASNFMRAYREASEGITSRSNQPLFYGTDRMQANWYETLLRGIGFNPATIAEMREIQYRERRIERNYSQMRSEIYERIRRFHLQPPERRNRDQWYRIMREVEAYNARVRRRGLAHISEISDSTIKSIITRMETPHRRERVRSGQE